MSDTCHRRINLGCSNRKIISCLERSINMKKSSKLYPGRDRTPTKKKEREITDENDKMVKKGIKSSQALSLQKYNTLNIKVRCQGLCQFCRLLYIVLAICLLIG